MPRQKSTGQSLTPLELEIMHILWESGPANVQAVQSALTSRDLAYTTVQTMLNVLHRKGKVKRRLKDRTYIYQPILSRQKAVAQAIGGIVDRFFGGSPDGLVLNLLETRRLTPEKMAKIQALLEEKHGTD